MHTHKQKQQFSHRGVQFVHLLVCCFYQFSEWDEDLFRVAVKCQWHTHTGPEIIPHHLLKPKTIAWFCHIDPRLIKIRHLNSVFSHCAEHLLFLLQMICMEMQIHAFYLSGNVLWTMNHLMAFPPHYNAWTSNSLQSSALVSNSLLNFYPYHSMQLRGLLPLLRSTSAVLTCTDIGNHPWKTETTPSPACERTACR